MKKCFTILLVFALLINCFTLTSFASEEKPDSKITTKIDYSFSKQNNWKDMSLDEKLELCQIPMDAAEKMTTEALLDSILENPFTALILAFDSNEAGYQRVKELIPAFQILLNRSDLGSVMTKKYTISSEKKSNQDIMSSMYLSVMLAQPEIEKIVSNVDIKSFETSLKVTDNQIYRISKEEHKIKDDTTEGVQALAASGYYDTTTTTTNKGTTIEVKVWTGVDFNTSEQEAAHQSFISLFSYSSYVHPATLKYNCHSYAFYAQSTSNPYWMEGLYADKYMTDGSYYKVSTPTASDRVHWHNGDHSGIIVGVGSAAGNVTVISKYGSYGVYRAFIGDVSSAYGDSNYTFWRR